ncbi:hypothetical protein HAX54_005122, partial [Datura stramonium]|nr:hypothetical protein [Datura stramonium]
REVPARYCVEKVVPSSQLWSSISWSCSAILHQTKFAIPQRGAVVTQHPSGSQFKRC